jgi:hypothetical protein
VVADRLPEASLVRWEQADMGWTSRVRALLAVAVLAAAVLLLAAFESGVAHTVALILLLAGLGLGLVDLVRGLAD